MTNNLVSTIHDRPFSYGTKRYEEDEGHYEDAFDIPLIDSSGNNSSANSTFISSNSESSIPLLQQSTLPLEGAQRNSLSADLRLSMLSNFSTAYIFTLAFGGEREKIHKAARDSALVAGLEFPGYFASVYMLERQSPRWIQIQGFVVMCGLYTPLAVSFNDLRNHPMSLLAVYGSTFFFSNYGPNATTLLLPSMTFSRHCRSSMNGVCAACGKVGALLGSIVFRTAVQRYGQSAVFGCCAALSFMGCIITLVCVSPLQSTERHDRIPKEAAAARIPSVCSMPSLFDFYEEARV
jgi:hypothetical protein